MENVENGSQNGNPDRSFFGHLAPFFRARRRWEPKWLTSLPQEHPRPVQASISIDFYSILDDLLMIFCITRATFYLVCFIILILPFQRSRAQRRLLRPSVATGSCPDASRTSDYSKAIEHFRK